MPRLIVDTGMDTKPVLNGIKDMNSAIRSLRSVVSQAGKDMDVAVVGYAKAMRNNAAASREAKARVQELDAAYAALMHELEAMAMTKYMTPEFVEYTNELHKQEELLARLNSARKKDATAINETEKEIRNLKQALQELKNDGKDFVLGSETEEYDRLEEQARNTIAAANRLRAQADKELAPLHIKEWNQMATATGAVANGLARVVYAGQMLGHAILHPFQALNRIIPMVVSGLGSLAKKAWDAAVSLAKTVVRNVISFMHRLGDAARKAAINLARLAGTAIVSGIKKIGTMAARAGKAILSVGKSAKRGNTSLKQAVTMLIRYGFGVRSIFMLVRRLRTALVDAFKNMAQAVPEVNVVMSKLSASLGQLKNSLATAFQPILSAIAPLLNTFIEMLTEAMTRVGMFFAALTGQDYVYKAAKANVDLAKSLDKTKKSAKEAENQLAGFDHLNILKAPNDSGSSSGANANAADSGGFQKAPLLESIKNFASMLKDMLLNGEFAELGKLIAGKVNDLFNSIDLYGIAQKLGGLVNNVVVFYNSLMEAIDWANIGRKFADGINGLLNSVNWSQLGKALSQRINAIWGIIYGLVTKVDWVGAGRALAEAVWGYFGSIDWDKIGKTIGIAINGISAAIIKFATTFPWKEMGAKVVSGLNNLFDTTNLKWLVEAFIKTLNGALDMLLEIVGGFKWGENGEKFRLAVLKLIESFPADKLGHLLSIAIKGILDLMAPTISDPKVWSNLGTRLGTFLNRLFTDREMWNGIGEAANGMLNGILTFGQSFLATFKVDEAADNIKRALTGIDFDTIATNTWNLIKTAFKKAGDFLNVLFADESNSHYDPWKKMYIPDPGTTLGTRIGKKINDALTAIPWDSIGKELWEAARKAFSFAGDILTSMFGVTDKDIEDAGGDKINAITRKIGSLLGEIPWNNILKAVGTRLLSAVQGLLDGLTNSENGTIVVAVVSAIGVLKTAITAALKSSAAAISVAGLGIFDALVIAYDVKEIKKLAAGYADTIDANKENVKNSLDTYRKWVESGNKDIADEYAMMVAGIDTTNKSADAALAELEQVLTQKHKDSLPEYVNIIEGVKEGAKKAWNGLVGTITGKKPEVEKAVEGAFVIPLDSDLQPKLEKAGTSAANAYTESVKNEFATASTTTGPELVSELGNVFDVVQNSMPIWANATVKDYYDAFKARYTENGEVKEGLRAAVDEILGAGASESIKNGDMTAEMFYNAYQEYVNAHKGEAQITTQSAFSDITDQSENAKAGAEKTANAAVDATITKLEERQSDVKQVSDDTFTQLPSPDELTELGYLAANTSVDANLQKMEERQSEVKQMAHDTFGTKTQEGIDESADATESTMRNAMDKVVNVTETKWGEASSKQDEALRGMEGNTSTGMTNITNDVAAGTTDQRQPVYDNWDLIASFMQLTLEGMKTNVLNAMNSMLSSMQSGMSSMESAATDGMNGVGNSVSNSMSSISSAVSNVDWWSVGDNIVAGIIDGMNDNWKWLQSTAKTLANNLLISTKNALGIASPSRIFRDEVGVMLGLGIAEGMEDSQPAILGSVSNVADAMADEMNGTDMAFNVSADAALDSFGDKITNSFTTLLDRLKSIADRVTFQTPTIATGTVLPYNVQAQSANGSKDIVNALEVSNDDLANVIIQATNNAVSALVDAIRRSGNTSGGDLNNQTSRIIDEINRRTRAQGTSPIII